MEYLPPYYGGNKTMEELQRILTVKTEEAALKFEETVNQCFINTATALLSRYEKIYGITVDVTKSDGFRRERILAKARGTGTVTKKMLAETASAYSNGEVEVIEDVKNNYFTVKFVGTKGIPANMADLTLTIEEIKPAHLSFAFEYTYNTWKDVSNMTWQEAKAYTWKVIRERS
ncbi:putative phage tail protein [Anaerocolumna xylanovorans]|nr:putative phage tail protein [Anaerocolumna xylanovorans]